MAFHYYTIDTIKNIDAADIPEAFVSYYRKLSEEMQKEIKDVRPDLVSAIEDSGTVSEKIESKQEPGMTSELEPASDLMDDAAEETTDDDLEIQDVENSQDDTFDEDETDTEADDESEDVSSIIDAWEDITIRAWQEPVVDSSVAVCKVVPQNTTRCRIHRIPLLQKQLRIKHSSKRSGGSFYSIKGCLCPECMDFYIENEDIDVLTKKLSEYGIPAWIQPLEETIAEWNEKAQPQEFDNDTPIYVPETWLDTQKNCPIHPEEPLVEDSYQKSYKNRVVRFHAFHCNKCQKYMLRNSLAQKLETECGEIGIPPIEFRPLLHEHKSKASAAGLTLKPDYFVHDGLIDEYYFDDGDLYYERITESDIVVINDTRSCIEEDHDAEDTIGLIRVQEKKKGQRLYLVLIGYCEECGKYYIAKEDFELMAEKGRPALTVIDETGTFNTITSGKTFEEEKTHLDDLEKDLDKEIEGIKNKPGFVEKYAVGDYDDGALWFGKKASESLYKEIDQLNGYKAKPYGYRTDITSGDQTYTYFFGANDIILKGDEDKRVLSFNSDMGRKMVNYRTLELDLGGIVYKVKRRRTFDIENALLYGFTEQSDEDVIFRSGITDSFLINVLNMRKKHHQLIDIISTIQENQNAIIDVPLKENLIVQGCAGSGKTMVLLHRLSALKYNHQEFDFGNTIILTPSKNFNTHIAGLASSLQLGYIQRLSVEEYYHQLLQRYDDSFTLKNPIADEMNVKQEYVDHVYSDEFRGLLKSTYDQVITEIRNFFTLLNRISFVLGRELVDADAIDGNALVEKLRSEITAANARVSFMEEECRNAEIQLAELNKQYKETEELIQKEEEQLRETVPESTKRANSVLHERFESLSQQAESLELKITEKANEIERIEGAIFVVRKAHRLETLREELNDLNEQNSNVTEPLKRIEKLLNDVDLSAANQEEQVEFLKHAALFSPEIEEIQRMVQEQLETANLHKSMQKAVAEKASAARDALLEARNKKPSKEIQEQLELLNEQVNPLTPKGIYEEVYGRASQKADDVLFARTGKRYIKGLRGTHRYDLYLQLLFAEHYFGKAIGNNNLICVDEAQDLTPGEYRLISSINGGNAVFNIYGDTNQLLKTGRGIKDWKAIEADIHDPKYFSLNENYRNTNQITEYCNDAFKMQVSQTGVDGRAVREISRVKLENTISRLKISEERIAIILPRSVKKDKYIDMEQLPSLTREVIGSEVGNGKIAVVYVDEVKGVEFDRVFVVPNSMTKNEQYIAFTRALSELTIVYDESLNPHIEEPKGQDTATETVEVSAPKTAYAYSGGNVYIGKVSKKQNKEDKEKAEKFRQKFRVVHGNITKVKADAIVSPYSTNSKPGTLSAAIQKVAGKLMMNELNWLPPCEVGDACVTRGYGLSCKYVIHSNSPNWKNQDEEDRERSISLLQRSYESIMQCATDNKVRTIAIPTLSVGHKGFPARIAAFVAVNTIEKYVANKAGQFDQIIFTVYDKDNEKIYSQFLRHIGKNEKARIRVGNCRKCGKEIRIRKKLFNRFALEGYIPSYCSNCKEDVCEQITCGICGKAFEITNREKDYSEQTGRTLLSICPSCNNSVDITKISVKEAMNVNTTGSITKTAEVEVSPEAVNEKKGEDSSKSDPKMITSKRLPEKEEVGLEEVSDEYLQVTSTDEQINETKEVRKLDYLRILEVLPQEMLSSGVLISSQEIKGVLYAMRIKTNEELLWRLSENSEVFESDQLGDIEKYVQDLIMEMFYM